MPNSFIKDVLKRDYYSPATAKPAQEEPVKNSVIQSVTGFFDGIGKTILEASNKAGEQLSPLKENPFYQQSPIAKKILTSVAPGAQAFIEGGFKGYKDYGTQKAEQEKIASEENKKELEAAKAQGASTWELAKISSKSPESKMAFDAVMGFVSFESAFLKEAQIIAKEVNPEIIGSVLKKLNIPEKFLPKLSEKLSKISDELQVGKILDNFMGGIKKIKGYEKEIARLSDQNASYGMKQGLYDLRSQTEDELSNLLREKPKNPPSQKPPSTSGGDVSSIDQAPPKGGTPGESETLPLISQTQGPPKIPTYTDNVADDLGKSRERGLVTSVKESLDFTDETKK